MHPETIIDRVDVVLVLLCAPLAPMRRVSFVGRTRAGTSNHASTRPRASKFHLTLDLTTRFP